MIEKRKCYGCGETKPYTSEYWAWKDKTHTKLRTRCRSCTNFDSKMSHRIQRAKKREEKC